jgi:hypothetical protein
MNRKYLPFILCALLSVAFTPSAKCQTTDSTYQNTDTAYQTPDTVAQTIIDTAIQVTDDSAAIDDAIATFYQTLSYTSVDQNRYSDLPQLFTAQGVLISNAGEKPTTWTIQQYVQLANDNFKSQQMESWDQEETCAQTHVFGKIAQRFSTYKITYVAAGTEIKRSGINAFQLIKEGGKWVIASVAWDRASETLPIPAAYSCE